MILSKQGLKDVEHYLKSKTDQNPYLFAVKDRHIGARHAEKIVKKAAWKAGITLPSICSASRA